VGSFHWSWNHVHGLFLMSWSVCPLLRGNNLESILLISPVADCVSPPQDAGVQIYNSFSGCRAHSALHWGWNTDSLICSIDSQTQHSQSNRIKLNWNRKLLFLLTVVGVFHVYLGTMSMMQMLSQCAMKESRRAGASGSCL
jgi:hypothetical protein